ncbi:AKAP7 2'5' RNA ligase-like domain family protein [Leishmania donovani]|uniref:AKAP7 2'5' RNA ligase-like domain family protein n=1 Tax=Leishmania donovani TaxID=5661 RepID=A0A504XWM3_LEIDO|nr:AKAP7 2'5' RNA ligase-like domain family protein [Leishmania donovani]
MAHLIAPASSVQPMTEEDFAVVQAEKRVDAATREQLVNVYGDSRAPHGRRVALTRPPKREWRCAACGKRSADIRHVCAFCLSPEPGYSSNIAASRPRNAGGPAVADKVVGPLTCVQRPGTCEDADVRLLQVSLTNRTYRVFTEPHTSAAKPRAAASHRSAAGADSATARPAVEEVDEVMVWDDEPNCGDRGTGESCSAGDDEGGSECDDEGVPSPAPHTQRRPPRAEKVNGGFTHFVSIPFGKLPAVAANATSILADLRSFLVTGTAKLHMTLLLLTLPRREDVEFAKELLHGPFASAWAATKEKWAASKDTTYALSGDASLAPVHRHPLVRLGGGLQVMRTGRQNEFYHPEKASVVYMGIDNAAGLATVQQLQRVLHESLAELIHDPEEAEKSRRVLHVTIMDKKWRKGRAASRPFDARPIMEAFQEAAIGAGEDGRQLFEIPELELCSLRRQDPESGTYLAETTVKI